MPESRPPIDLNGIEPRRAAAADRRAPAAAGRSMESASVAAIRGMRIARDGTWYHDGAPIRRPAMVRLFSTVLRREPDGRHVLVTPVEKLDIEVERTAVPRGRDAERGRRPRSAHRLPARQRRCGDPRARASAARRASDHGPSPRILVRHGLEAELTRAGLLRARRARARRGHRAARRVERRRLLPAG